MIIEIKKHDLVSLVEKNKQKTSLFCPVGLSKALHTLLDHCEVFGLTPNERGNFEQKTQSLSRKEFSFIERNKHV